MEPRVVGFVLRENFTSPYAAITTAADWSDVTTALGVVAAALALVLVFRKGAKMILGFFGR